MTDSGFDGSTPAGTFWALVNPLKKGDVPGKAGGLGGPTWATTRGRNAEVKTMTRFMMVRTEPAHTSLTTELATTRSQLHSLPPWANNHEKDFCRMNLVQTLVSCIGDIRTQGVNQFGDYDVSHIDIDRVVWLSQLGNDLLVKQWPRSPCIQANHELYSFKCTTIFFLSVW